VSHGIIVGYDGSDCAKAALRAGLEVGRAYDETVTIAFGYELSPVGGEIHDYHLALQELAEGRLAEARQLADVDSGDARANPPIETIVVGTRRARHRRGHPRRAAVARRAHRLHSAQAAAPVQAPGARGADRLRGRGADCLTEVDDLEAPVASAD
jgi:hypothetical protein